MLTRSSKRRGYGSWGFLKNTFISTRSYRMSLRYSTWCTKLLLCSLIAVSVNRHQLSSYDSAWSETRKQHYVTWCPIQTRFQVRGTLRISSQAASRCSISVLSSIHDAVIPKSTFIFMKTILYELESSSLLILQGVVCRVSMNYSKVLLPCDVSLLPVWCCDKLVVQSVILQHLFLNTLYKKTWRIFSYFS